LKDSCKMKESDRRSFLRKIFTLTASAGVAGLLLDRIPGKSVVQPVEAQGNMTIDAANTGTGTTSLSSSGNPALTATSTGNGAALQGTCTVGTGVMGATTGSTNSGTGVQGVASGAGGTALAGFAGNSGAIPIVAQGASGQTANLQEWRGGSGLLSAVQPSGAMIAPQLGQTGPNLSLSTPGNPSGFSNVNPTFKMDGLAVQFTPKLTGNVNVVVNLDQYNTHYPANVYAQLWYGTGTAPSFGASTTGTQVGPTLSFSTGVASQIAHGSITVPITGLTVGTAYWFDLAGAVFSSGTGFHNNISIYILEI
jgi:hypothetical protein